MRVNAKSLHVDWRETLSTLGNREHVFQSGYEMKCGNEMLNAKMPASISNRVIKLCAIFPILTFYLEVRFYYIGLRR